MLIEDLEQELANLIGESFKIKIIKGEVVIFTGLKEDSAGELVSLSEDDDYIEDMEDTSEDYFPDDFSEEDSEDE